MQNLGSSFLERSATTDDRTLAAPGPLATRKEMRSTPLRGGLPAETHISPFPEDDDILPSNARVKEWPRVERPRAGSQAEKNGQNVCSTKECEEAADELMAAMNTTANPCDDFFVYTCGNWIKDNPIPFNSSVKTIINDLRLELNLRVKEILKRRPLSNDSASVLDAKSMFAACVDNETLESLGLTRLTDFMGQHGGWPMATGGGDPDWQETAAAWIREVMLNTLVTVSVGPDDMDTDMNLGSSFLERSATTDDRTLAAPGPLATRKEMRSTPLRGGLPAETHISPFPEDDDILPSNARVKEWPRVERPRAGSQAEKNGQNVCSTKECEEAATVLPKFDGRIRIFPPRINAADELMAAMNRTANPCDDFFVYTCGNWIKDNPIPFNSSVKTIINDLRLELNLRVKEILKRRPLSSDSASVLDAKSMFAACVDNETLESLGLTRLTDFMGQNGGWPMATGGGDPDWQETAAAWIREVMLNTLVTVSVGPDDMDTDMNVLYLDQSSLGLSNRDVYLNPSLHVILDPYKDLLKGTAKLVRDHHGSAVTDAAIDREAEEVIAFEVALAEIVVPSSDRRNVTARYNRLSLADLQNATDAGAPGVLDQSSLGLSNRDVYLNPSLHVILDPYKDLLKGTAKLVRDHHGSAVTDAAIDREAEGVIAFEVALAEIVVPSSDRRNVTARYNKLSLADLQNATDAGAPGVVSQHAKIQPNSTNYLHWRLVYAVGDETNEEMRDLFFNYSKIISGINEPPAREDECASLVNSMMGMAVGSVYVSESFPATAKEEVEQLVKDLKAAFEEILDSIDWMDAATRKKAKDKNDAIRAFIGYPDFILDPKALADYYAGIIVNNSTHLWNAFSLLGWSWRRQAAGVNKPVHRDAWITHPTVVNAFYYPRMNSITFPAGILQSPIYQQGRPAAMNYGGIGTVIGHEITHGFDNSGRQYDAKGNLVNWWTDATADAFVGRAQCFIDQYNGYDVPELSGVLNSMKLKSIFSLYVHYIAGSTFLRDFHRDYKPGAYRRDKEHSHVNGVATLGENIADNGGLSEAWLAYLKYIDRNGTEPSLPGLNLTTQQLFFVASAYNWCGHSTVKYLLNQILNGVHSPAKFRVYGPLSNNVAFAKTFGCKADDFMFNGVDSCVIW
ncbi:unnamed protein product [Darwinula stevensoni]|uniref:Uncharacterized protein n=1 Tax=Darwinula stevensoni TaxID=69355 RepID=A0A7R9FRA7_9CRUS|nr:unnamed protein product [Darwinula stevensoni]CAG0900640.1 unnamed protein product [Darwinula stevensoni]